jgi:TonB family protein
MQLCPALAALLGLIFAAASAAETKTDQKPAPLEVGMGLPVLQSWSPPEYPKEAADRKLEGRVQLRIVVDESGVVTKARALRSTDKVFEDAAVESVRQWHFDPAVEDGRQVAKSIDLVLPFRLADLKRTTDPTLPPSEVTRSLDYSPRTAVEQSRGDPDYPDSLLPRHLSGEVLVDFSVGPDGGVQGLKVLAATHADFVRPSIDAVEKSRFKPAMQGDLPVSAPLKGTLEFTPYEEQGLDVLGANGVTLAKTQTGNPDLDSLDKRPEVARLVDPVYPYELLLAGTEGEAVADFVIGATGAVESVAVREATRPEFGRALAAALEGWIFRPARKGGSGVPLKATKRQKFSLAAAGSATAPVARLVGRLRSQDTDSMKAKNLDARLCPRFQEPPRYPARWLAERPSGKAEIQFIIDREGRCRLARIISASQEEFGWAAATAVERWVFDPPMRGGTKVDVRVNIPFSFVPPKK